ncbi:glycerate kinase [uncultured Acetobacterium sp.]|uniref:glycerate kinase n=1 Tax=uncultured Acetobacterium sp. TaxID=217139 RepID=UPI00344B468C
MKVVIAPDSFKGSLSGFEVCDIVEDAILQVFPEAEIKKSPYFGWRRRFSASFNKCLSR